MARFKGIFDTTNCYGETGIKVFSRKGKKSFLCLKNPPESLIPKKIIENNNYYTPYDHVLRIIEFY